MLYYPNMVLHSAAETLKYFRLFVDSKREKFDEYEEAAWKLSGSQKHNDRLNPLDYTKS